MNSFSSCGFGSICPVCTFHFTEGVTWRNERFTNKTPGIIRLCPTNEGQKFYHTSLKVTSKYSFQIGLMGPESLRLHLQSHYLKLSVTSREILFTSPLPPVDRQIDTYENITFATPLAGGNNHNISCHNKAHSLIAKIHFRTILVMFHPGIYQMFYNISLNDFTNADTESQVKQSQ